MRRWPLSGTGKYLTWGVCLAGVLDVIENIGLTVMLLVKVSSPWPQLAAVCAAGKFLLVALALLYITFGGIAWVTGSKPTK
jgi:hypothetical protein